MVTARNPVIVCGSGPSLLKVPYASIGIPLCSISTAIRFTPAPKYWVLVDRINNAHGRETMKREHAGPGGVEAAKDPDIIKVVPANRKKFFDKYPNVVYVGRQKQLTYLQDSDQVAVSQQYNRSMLFAIEWLMKYGHHDVLIFVGMDHRINPGEPLNVKAAKRTNSRNQGHIRECTMLKGMHETAVEKGFTWLSWTPGAPVNKFMEAFDADGYRRSAQGAPGDAGVRAGVERTS